MTTEQALDHLAQEIVEASLDSCDPGESPADFVETCCLEMKADMERRAKKLLQQRLDCRIPDEPFIRDCPRLYDGR